MMKKSLVMLLVSLLGAAAQGAEHAPRIEGFALCRQPLPGQTEALSTCDNLVLVSVPGGRPVPLFSKTPVDNRPAEGFYEAVLLDGGHRVILHLSHREASRDGSVLVVDVATGRLASVADDVHREPFLVSPRRDAVLFRDRKTDRLCVWHIDGRQLPVRLPKGWFYDAAEWSPNMPHPYLKLEDGRGRAKCFWLDELRGAVTPIPPGNPWLRALDVKNGRYLVVDEDSNLWLKGPGRKPAKLAHLDADGGPPDDVWARFSPAGRYVVCTTSRAVGEPHINWTGRSYYFDLRGERPVQLRQPKDCETWIGSGDFLGWGTTEEGILHKSVWNLMWTPLPSLRTRTIYKLPDRCQFEDFVRRDAAKRR